MSMLLVIPSALRDWLRSKDLLQPYLNALRSQDDMLLNKQLS